jgi:hypothetical protein
MQAEPNKTSLVLSSNGNSPISARSKSRNSARKEKAKNRMVSDFNLDDSSTQDEELVRFGVDMSKLSDYLDNIIRAVN